MAMPLGAPSGVKVWCDSVYDTAIGKTKGTFDPINSNQATIKIQKRDAQSILGFLINYASTVKTDAENTPDAIIRLNSKALGISDVDFVVPLGGDDADAASSWSPRITKYIPFRTDKPEKLFNSELALKVAPSVINTGGLDIAVGLLYSNAEPSSQFQMELMAQMHKRFLDGSFSADEAKAMATALTTVTLSNIEIPTGPTNLLGILAKLNPNGITASDPVGGVIEFFASGIQDFSPQIWPLCTFWNPTLGTVIDQAAMSGEGRYYPTRFPLSGAAVTVGTKITPITGQGTAPDTTQALLYE